MAQVIHQNEKEIWVFASKQMGGLRAVKNMIDSENYPLEEMVRLTTEEAKGVLPEGAKIEDIKVETTDLNGPIINVVVKAVID